MPSQGGGGWSDAELLETVAEYAGVGTDADLPEVDRFRAAVSRLILKSALAESEESNSGLSVFLLKPSGPPAPVADRCARVPMLDRGLEPLRGRIWFVTHVVTTGNWMPADFDSDDELFRFVTDELDGGDVPSIIFDPRDSGPELRFYKNGLVDPENVEWLQIANSQISLGRIFGCIDRIHSNQLVTPGSQSRGGRIWAKAAKGTTVSNAEDVLSALLEAGLHSAFPTCRIRVEQPQPTGRLDIEVEERILGQPGAVMRHAILELKVLRGRNPNGTKVSKHKTDTAISDGVEQAAAYRLDRQALKAALCCFDMRPGHTDHQCFAHVIQAAKDMGVELRAWHLFQSSQEYRRHLASSGALAISTATD